MLSDNPSNINRVRCYYDKVKFLLIVLVLILIAGLIFITKQPGFIYDRIFGRVLGVHTQSDPSFPLPTSNNPISQTENSMNSVIDTTQQSTNNFKNNLQQTLQTGLNSLFGQPSSATSNTTSNSTTQASSNNSVSVQVINSSSPPPSNQSTTTIDLSQSNNLKISLTKGSKYYLHFQNPPASSCLYVNGNKYPIDSQQTVEIQILSSGAYPLSVSPCNINNQSIGEIDVQ